MTMCVWAHKGCRSNQSDERKMCGCVCGSHNEIYKPFWSFKRSSSSFEFYKIHWKSSSRIGLRPSEVRSGGTFFSLAFSFVVCWIPYSLNYLTCLSLKDVNRSGWNTCSANCLQMLFHVYAILNIKFLFLMNTMDLRWGQPSSSEVWWVRYKREFRQAHIGLKVLYWDYKWVSLKKVLFIHHLNYWKLHIHGNPRGKSLKQGRQCKIPSISTPFAQQDHKI